MTKKQKITVELLQAYLSQIEKSLLHLEYSEEKCSKVELKPELSNQDLAVFESLTSRFARTVDIYTQKLLKSLVFILQEDLPTFPDKMNFCEKIGAISAADDLTTLRGLRNSIAHEYEEARLSELFAEVLQNIPTLKTSIGLTRDYIQNKILSNA